MEDIIDTLRDNERLLHLEYVSTEDSEKKELFQLAHSSVQEALSYLDELNNL